MNKHVLLAPFAILLFTAPAIAKESYSETTKINETDASGTASSLDRTVNRKTDKDGTTNTTIKTTATNDPKGLFNKSKVKTTEKVTTDKDGNITKDDTVMNGKVVDKMPQQ